LSLNLGIWTVGYVVKSDIITIYDNKKFLIYIWEKTNSHEHVISPVFW
jgi:hypothetical protein